MKTGLTQRYDNLIKGVLNCYDRVVVTGTLPVVSNAKHLTSFMYQNGIRIFDYAIFAKGFRDTLRENAHKIAQDNGILIEHVRSNKVRKEALIEKVLKTRGYAPGLVHILSAMEACNSYQPWHDKVSGKNYLRYDQGKCLTYYFYFIDEILGLCYVRVPTWLPFKLQIYFNGHNWLSNELHNKRIAHQLVDNAFVDIADWDKAQQISNRLSVKKLHKKLDAFAKKYCPVFEQFKQTYHWSIMQCEYATDIVFRSVDQLSVLYQGLVTKAIASVKPENIVSFLGKKLDPRYLGEIGSDYRVRLKGSRIKHIMGSTSIKMYDKHGHILRIETTANDVSDFKHYREVIHLDGTRSHKDAAMKKHIYSMDPLRDILRASNTRYLDFISAIDDDTIGHKKLEKATTAKKDHGRTYKGLNFFDKTDKSIINILLRGENNIYGFRSKDLAKHLPFFTKGQLSRSLKRLRVLGIIKKVGKSYKYYLTSFGKEVLICSQKVINMVMIPQLANAS